jgi:hypothetical protein
MTTTTSQLNQITMHPFVSKVRTTNHPLARLRRSLKQSAAEISNGKRINDANRNISLTRLNDALQTELPSDLKDLITSYLLASEQ